MWEIPGYFSPRSDIVSAETNKEGLLKLPLMSDKLALPLQLSRGGGYELPVVSLTEVGGLWARLVLWFELARITMCRDSLLPKLLACFESEGWIWTS